MRRAVVLLALGLVGCAPVSADEIFVTPRLCHGSEADVLADAASDYLSLQDQQAWDQVQPYAMNEAGSLRRMADWIEHEQAAAEVLRSAVEDWRRCR